MNFTASIFAALSVVFAILTVRGYLKAGKRIVPALKAWAIIAVMFAAVACWLFVTVR